MSVIVTPCNPDVLKCHVCVNRFRWNGRLPPGTASLLQSVYLFSLRAALQDAAPGLAIVADGDRELCHHHLGQHRARSLSHHPCYTLHFAQINLQPLVGVVVLGWKSNKVLIKRNKPGVRGVLALTSGLQALALPC